MTPPLRLTAAHVAQVPPYLGPPQPFDLAGEVATEADHQALFDQLMRSAPKQVWVFAYGSFDAFNNPVKAPEVLGLPVKTLLD